MNQLEGFINKINIPATIRKHVFLLSNSQNPLQVFVLLENGANHIQFGVPASIHRLDQLEARHQFRNFRPITVLNQFLACLHKFFDWPGIVWHAESRALIKIEAV